MRVLGFISCLGVLEGIARLARAWEAYAPAARPGAARAAPAPAQVDVLV